MKKSLILTFLIFSSIFEAFAQIESNNIYYKIQSYSEFTATVADLPGNKTCSGAKEIPNLVTDEFGIYRHPYEVIAIEPSAFKGNTKLTSIYIPILYMNSIGDDAFNGCTALKKVTIANKAVIFGTEYPAAITFIGKKAFYGCTNLNTITIPSSTKHIGDEAFYGCTALTQIYSYMDSPNIANWNYPAYSAYEEIFSEVTYSKATLYVPKGCAKYYKQSGIWSKFKNIVEFNTAQIDEINVDDNGQNVTLWYDLCGRVFNQKPTAPGVYIHNHQKVVIK